MGPTAAVVAPASVATSLPVSSWPKRESAAGPEEQQGVYMRLSFQRRIRRASEERRSQRGQTGTARGRPGTRIIRVSAPLQKTHGGGGGGRGGGGGWGRRGARPPPPP